MLQRGVYDTTERQQRTPLQLGRNSQLTILLLRSSCINQIARLAQAINEAFVVDASRTVGRLHLYMSPIGVLLVHGRSEPSIRGRWQSPHDCATARVASECNDVNARALRYLQKTSTFAYGKALTHLKHGLEDGDEHAGGALAQLLKRVYGLRRNPHAVQ